MRIHILHERHFIKYNETYNVKYANRKEGLTGYNADNNSVPQSI